MTNSDVKREMNLIHNSLIDLTELSSMDGINGGNLHSFIAILEKRYESVLMPMLNELIDKK